VRVAVEDSPARINLSYKFGCAPGAVPALLAQAAALGVAVKGLSFHVGSQITDPACHVQAIERCAALIADNHATGDGHLTVLDIGGGFPAAYDADVPAIETFCAPLREALARLPGYVRVIAEPGRFIAAEAVRSIATVVGKAERAGRPWYYLDDGVYGSFSGHIFDGARYPLRAMRRAGAGDADAASLRPATLAGPTCDSVDIVSEDSLLPELAIGDFVVADRMGAYTAATANDFNLVGRARIVVVNGPGASGARHQVA
ncbi:MAG: type III PLP-dependent enzyme, partial [Gammaproteobacteria bacterium]|nr:type III PLP-dependent enzyme [Gammaproteobacteria bacterium]